MKRIINQKGFTLIELLVVIAIIAILSVIGITIFTTTQANARDGRRKADIDAIAAALESKRTPGTIFYLPLVAGDFSGSTIPTDTTTAKYCIKLYTADDGAKIDPDPTIGAAGTTVDNTWVGLACPYPYPNPPTTWYQATVAEGFQTLASGGPFATSATNTAANKKSWKVCAKLENSTVYCKNSAQ